LKYKYEEDQEARYLAEEINRVLFLANWRLDNVALAAVRVLDGITVETRPEEPALSAAQELAEYFEANGLRVATASIAEPFRLEEIREGVIRIRVGMKPSPYFESKLSDDQRRRKRLWEVLFVPGLDRRDLSEEEKERKRIEWDLPE
jgi:hypothetical protein